MEVLIDRETTFLSPTLRLFEQAVVGGSHSRAQFFNDPDHVAGEHARHRTVLSEE
jgi:hypothetical protein